MRHGEKRKATFRKYIRLTCLGAAAQQQTLNFSTELSEEQGGSNCLTPKPGKGHCSFTQSRAKI